MLDILANYAIMNNMETKNYYTVKEAAFLLDVLKGRVYVWIRNDTLSAYQLNPGVKGSALRIPVSEVQRILDERREQLMREKRHK